LRTGDKDGAEAARHQGAGDEQMGESTQVISPSCLQQSGGGPLHLRYVFLITVAILDRGPFEGKEEPPGSQEVLSLTHSRRLSRVGVRLPPPARQHAVGVAARASSSGVGSELPILGVPEQCSPAPQGPTKVQLRRIRSVSVLGDAGRFRGVARTSCDKQWGRSPASRPRRAGGGRVGRALFKRRSTRPGFAARPPRPR